ncbi:hypothetical protein JOE69_000491 [Arthrobacter russicus]|uniref:Uncharacterized protein n=1 Tax=Arthrobacter russicus TaxID=172040 RepID=A0ABU1J754_9MICC|nr:hypothetical protein [Arthrobacter russicus]
MTRIVRQAHSAFGAQTLAVFLAHRLERQCCDYRIPQHRFEIEMIVLDQALFVVVLKLLFGAPFGNGLFEEEHLLDVDIEVVRKGIQASAAFAHHVDGCSSRNKDSFVYGLQIQIEPDVRPFLNADHRRSEFPRSRDCILPSPHTAWTATEIFDRNKQW